MKERKGFTLVELLAVIVVLAIIMIIAIPSVLSTMTTAKRKTFGEYVTKVYNTANSKFLEDSMIEDEKEYVKYDISKDLGLSSTGNFKGYVVFLNRNDETQVYIGMSDDEYYTATQLGDDESTIVPYINYTLAGEPKYTETLSKYDGKTNSFVRGKYNNKTLEDIQEAGFNLPASNDDGELTEILDVTDPATTFFNSMKDFYTKALNIYKNGNAQYKNSQTVTNKCESCETTTTSTFTYGIVPYSQVGTAGTSNGWAVFVTIHAIRDKAPDGELAEMTANIQGIAFKDANYHTVLSVQATGQDSSGNKITQTMPLPVNIGGGISKNGSFRFVTPNRLESAKVIDIETLLETERKLFIGESEDNSLPATESNINKVNNEIQRLANQYAYYISNDIEDGIDLDNDYDVNKFVQKYTGKTIDEALSSITISSSDRTQQPG